MRGRFVRACVRAKCARKIISGGFFSSEGSSDGFQPIRSGRGRGRDGGVDSRGWRVRTWGGCDGLTWSVGVNSRVPSSVGVPPRPRGYVSVGGAFRVAARSPPRRTLSTQAPLAALSSETDFVRPKQRLPQQISLTVRNNVRPRSTGRWPLDIN